MAAGGITVTTTISQITGLTDGMTYRGQVRGRASVLYTEVDGSTAPTADSAHWFLSNPGDAILLKPQSGKSLWIYADESGSSVTYIEE